MSYYTLDISSDEINGFHTNDISIESNHTFLYKWDRYSNRQHSYMKLDGLIGSLTIKTNNKNLLKALSICSYLGLGKGSSLGLGQFYIL